MLNSVLFFVFLSYLVWRGERVLALYRDDRLKLEDRRMVLAERDLALKEKDLERPSPAALEPMPADLIADAMSESEPWAREEKMTVYKELFAQTKDWNQVKHIVSLRGR